MDVATLIPMADGSWKSMGELVAGDRIFDDKGSPCTVVAAHPVMEGRPCYELRFSDGAVVVCDEDHLWFTDTKADRSHHVGTRKGPRGASRYVSRTHAPRSGTVKTTLEIARTLRARGEKNHRIPLNGPLAYRRKALPVDPYLLGLWLGDGNQRCAHFTTADPEIAEALKVYADANDWRFVTLKHQNSGKATIYSLSGSGGNRYSTLTGRLRSLGLILNKHIPTEYAVASIGQRIDLLRGLMDSDGSIDVRVRTPQSRGRRCEITQKHKVLAQGIVSLLSSLGVSSTLAEKKVNGVSYWRISFSSWFNPFLLARKARLWQAASKRLVPSLSRFIVSAEPVASRPVRCITVDSQSRLYLCTRHLVPTHNTVACINDLIARALATRKEEARYAYLAPYRGQAKTIAWSYLKRYSQPLRPKVSESELSVRIANDAEIRLFGADNPDALRGGYLDGVILDEYANMRPSVWGEIVRPCLADRRGWATHIGTPKGHNAFFEIHEQARAAPEWFSALLKASETGLIPQEELDDAAKIMTADQYAQEFECSFEAAIHGAIYAKELAAARKDGRIGRVPHDPALPVNTTWDLGVGDSTAIWFDQVVGQEVRFIDYYENSGEGLPHYAKVLQDRGYVYGKHIAPHDIEVRELTHGRSRLEVAKSLGIRFEIAPNVALEDGIHALRLLLPRCWFDEQKCKAGIEALQHYRWERNERLDEFKDRPVHDWSSHGSDSARYRALALKEPTRKAAQTKRETHYVGSDGWMR